MPNHPLTITTFMDNATGTVQATEPLYQIRKHARSGRLHSIIVLDHNEPIGIIRWAEIERAKGIPETSLARDIMLADSPVLTPTTLVHEARSSLEITKLDRLPVVNGLGELIGVFNRDTLKVATAMSNGKPERPIHDQPTVQGPRRAFTVHPGMTVISEDRENVGQVDRLFLEQGVVTGFLVSYGQNKNLHKQLQFDLVDHLDDETIILTIDTATFLQLSDASSLDI